MIEWVGLTLIGIGAILRRMDLNKRGRMTGAQLFEHLTEEMWK